MTASPPTDPARGLRLSSFRLRRYATRLHVDTTFREGITVLLGVNGVGKTSLLRSLVHPELRAPGSTAAVVEADGSHGLPERLVCMLPQRPRLPSNLTVAEVLEYCCHVRGVAPVEAQQRIADLDLDRVAGRRTGRLSGGEAQRLNLALAFVGSPRVALLDEPTVALDPLGRKAFAAALRRLTRGASIVVMSTHVASDIEIADHVQVLGATGIVWRGSPPEFLALGPGTGFDDAFATLLSGEAR